MSDYDSSRVCSECGGESPRSEICGGCEAAKRAFDLGVQAGLEQARAAGVEPAPGGDGDIHALTTAARALLHSTSPRMLRANLEYLWDYFIGHPSPEVPERLRSKP